MLIDNVFFYFLIGVGIMLSLPALWLFHRARWSQRYEKQRVVAERRIFVTFLIGLVPTLLLGTVIGVVLSKVKSGDVGALAFDVLLLGFSVCWALSGLSGLVTLVGEKLTPTCNDDPFKTTLRGGIVAVFCLSMPFIGWFALIPLAIITGAGMNVRAWFVKAPAAAPPIPTA
jgi:hypothetical protein